MVRKLYKHEFLAWLRVMTLIYSITLLTAIFLRVIVAFETDSIYYQIISTSGILLLQMPEWGIQAQYKLP